MAPSCSALLDGGNAAGTFSLPSVSRAGATTWIPQASPEAKSARPASTSIGPPDEMALRLVLGARVDGRTPRIEPTAVVVPPLQRRLPLLDR